MMNSATKCPSGKKILAYSRGELSAKAKREVENHLLDCPLCDAAVEGFVENGIQSNQTDEILVMTNSTIDQTAYAGKPAPLKAAPLNWLPLLLAAAVALLLIVAWSAYRNQQVPQRIFATYFDPIPQADFSTQRAIVGARPRTEAENELLQQALDYHLAENYSFALTAWRAYLDENANQEPKAYLYAATAALATGKEDLAAYYLAQLPPGENSALGEETAWYRALLALKTEGTTAALDLLDKLPEPIQNADIREQRESLIAVLRDR